MCEPCKPDHCAHERNRLNRLKLLSVAPSIARRAAHTVRRFRHSNAPLASATAFGHVGRVNIAANGSNHISIARMPSDVSLRHDPFPREATPCLVLRKGVGDGRVATRTASPLACP